MVLDVMRIRLDRNTGRVITKKIVGQKHLDTDQVGSACVKLITNLSVEECYQTIRENLCKANNLEPEVI